MSERLWYAWIHQRGRSVRAAVPPFRAASQVEADARAEALTGTCYAFAIPGPAVVTPEMKQNAPSSPGGAFPSILRA